MPKRIVNNLERVLLVAVMWLLIKLNPIVSQNLPLETTRGDDEAMTSSSLNSYKNPLTRLVFSLAEQQQKHHHQQQHLLNGANSSSSSSKFLNEQSRLFKRLLQETTTTTTTSTKTTTTTKRTKITSSKHVPATTTRRTYLEEEMSVESNMKSNDHGDHDHSDDNGCRPKPIDVSLDLRSCGRVTLPTTECRGYCPSSEQMLASKLKKQTCWACKPHRYVYKNYKIRCMDNSIMNLRMKTIEACSCFKHSEKIIPL